MVVIPTAICQHAAVKAAMRGRAIDEVRGIEVQAGKLGVRQIGPLGPVR